MLKFDASIFGGELPVGLGVVGIAVVLPGGNFVDEDLFVGNAARSRHWDVRTPSSDSAKSQLPCLGVREVDVGQCFQGASVIHGGMAICDLDVAPAFERSKHHEEIGGAIARNGPGV